MLKRNTVIRKTSLFGVLFPYFPIFGLNTDYSINFSIKLEYVEIKTRKISEYRYFSMQENMLFLHLSFSHLEVKSSRVRSCICKSISRSFQVELLLSNTTFCSNFSVVLFITALTILRKIRQTHICLQKLLKLKHAWAPMHEGLSVLL